VSYRYPDKTLPSYCILATHSAVQYVRLMPIIFCNLKGPTNVMPVLTLTFIARVWLRNMNLRRWAKSTEYSPAHGS